MGFILGPFIVLAFGTVYMPRAKEPSRFGINEPLPQGILAQMRWPFTARP
jgi:hypothetical protein